MNSHFPVLYAPHITPLPGRPPLGAWLREVRQDMLRIIPARAYQEDIVTERLGPFRWHIISGPDAFRRVFRDNIANYPKAPIMRRVLGPYLGDGLLLTDTKDWAWQRRALGAAFSGQQIQSFAPAMQRVANHAVTRLAAAPDLFAQASFEMRVTATEMVRDTIFADLADDADPLGPIDPNAPRDFRAQAQRQLDRFLQTAGHPGLIDILGLIPGRRRQSVPLRSARGLIDRLIEGRRRSGDRPGDLLDLLLHAHDPESGRAMSDTVIRDNLMTFLITGSDTTALALTWSIYILTQSRAWAARLRAEADAAWDGAMMRTEQLALTQHFIQEVLRLFPPVPLVLRKAARPDEIAGTSIRRGDLIFAPIYALHRHPAHWQDPHRFDPFRFGPGTRRDGFAYLPFSAGPRACIGAGFAMLEAKIALATFVRELDFALMPGWDVRPVMIITLKPNGGLPVLIKRRTDGTKPCAA